MNARTERIEITCRGWEAFGSARHARTCHRARHDLTEATARSLQLYRESDRTFVCRACCGLGRVIRTAKHIVATTRASGLPGPIIDATDGAVRSWEAVETVMRMHTQEAVRSGRLRPKSAGSPEVQAARITRRAARRHLVAAGKAEPVDISRIRRAMWWKRGVRIEARICPGCGCLLVVKPSQPKQPRMHAQCFYEVMRRPEVSDYVRQWRSLTRDTPTPIPEYQARRRLGAMPIPAAPKRPDPEVLTRELGWAVRYRVGRESQATLASEAGVSRPRVAQGIAHVMGLLPALDRITDKTLRGLVVALSAEP